MIFFEACPVCGGELVEKKGEKLLRGGKNTAIVNVVTQVCMHCGERLYSQDIVARFEEIRRKLEKDDPEGFIPIGKTFEVA